MADEAGCSGDLRSSVPSAKWAFSVTPLDGWGPRSDRQRATAGWLAALPVFEPHWQVGGCSRSGLGCRVSQPICIPLSNLRPMQ